jgi:hypothetical protein
VTNRGRNVLLFLLGFIILAGLFGVLTLAFFPEQTLSELAWVALPALIIEGIVVANLTNTTGKQATRKGVV